MASRPYLEAGRLLTIKDPDRVPNVKRAINMARQFTATVNPLETNEVAHRRQQGITREKTMAERSRAERQALSLTMYNKKVRK
jgi:hypothetical protein